MKKILAILLLLSLAFSLVACGGAGTGDSNTPASDTGSGDVSASATDSNSEVSSEPEKEEWKPLEVVSNQFIVSDYENKRIVVYDIDKVPEGEDLSAGEIWALEGVYSASVKYRENTKYGTVVLTTNDGPVITDYATKETIWAGGAGKAGSNPHSIEILPSGNIVTASSTDGLIRIFHAYATIKEGAPLTYKSYDLPSAHGVLWDPEYNVLWAIGLDELVAYRVKVEDGVEVLSRINGMGAPLPKKGGHDLSADLMDPQYLWCTSGGVYRFDKENNEFDEKYDQYGKLNRSAVKGFGNNKNGNFIFSQARGDDDETLEGDPGWTTDIIRFCYWKSENFLYVREIQAKDCAFYKARVLWGDYQ